MTKICVGGYEKNQVYQLCMFTATGKGMNVEGVDIRITGNRPVLYMRCQAVHLTLRFTGQPSHSDMYFHWPTNNLLLQCFEAYPYRCCDEVTYNN